MRLLIYLLPLFTFLEAYNILVYSPAYGASHSYFMGKLADTLTDAGHNVTLLVPVMDVSRRNITGVKTTKDVVFVDQDEVAQKKFHERKNEFANLWTLSYKAEDFDDNIFVLHNNFIGACANLFRNKKVFEDMKARNFDVVLTEPLSICGVGFAYRLGIRKIIQTSSCTFFDYMNVYLGEPQEHSYVPSLFAQTSDQMNLMERYENFKTTHYMVKSVNRLFDEEERLYTNNYQIELPPWRELLAKTSIHFTNANPNLDFPRPTIQKTVLIGGISVDMDDIRSQNLMKTGKRF